MTHAARRHRALDAELDERLARDGEKERRPAFILPGHGGALLPSRLRYKDLRTMSRPRVLLTRLSVRTSAKGREYLSGWLGKASVVGFKGEPDKYGNEAWDLYLSEPEPRDTPSNLTHGSHRERQERTSAAVARGVDLDDSIPF
jgi:hypothetical protein